MVRRILTLALAACVLLPVQAAAQQGDQPAEDEPIEVPDEDEPIEVPDEDAPIEIPDEDEPIEIPDEDEPIEVPDEDDPAAVPDEDEAGVGEESADAVEPEEPTEVDTVLIEAPLQDMGTVGGSATRIGEEELERLEHDDPHSLLSGITGLNFRQEDAFGLRPNIGLRGANSDRSKKVTLMEDGVLFGPAPYSAPAAYYFPAMTRMTGVEVFKGPGAIIYGPNTIGGSINFLSRPIPVDPSGAADLAFGSYLSGKGHAWAGASNGWGGFLVEGVHLQSDGFKELDGGGETGFRKSEFLAKGRINTDLDADTYHEVELRLGYANELSKETYLGLSDADFQANPYRRYIASAKDEMSWDRTEVQLRYRVESGEAWDATVTAYRHDFHRGWFKLNGFRNGPTIGAILDDPSAGTRKLYYDVLTGAEDSTQAETLGIGLNDRTFVSQGAQSVIHWRTAGKWWSNSAEFGLRAHGDSIEREHTEDGFLVQSGALVSDGSQTLTLASNRGEAFAVAVHAIDQIGLGPLTLAPGFRVESIHTELKPLGEPGAPTLTNDTLIFLPGIGAHYALTESFGFLAGVHRGFSPVSPGQPDGVDPETAINYEGGLRYEDRDARVHAEAIGFYSDYNNLTGECSFSAGCAQEDLDQQFNAGRATIFGAEVSATAAPAAAGFTFPFRVGYTFTSAEFDAAFTSDNPQFGDVEAGDRLPYVPAHQLALGAGIEQERWGLNLGATFVDEMLETAGKDGDDDVRTTDRQFLLDAKAHASFFAQRLTVYGKIDNVTATTPIVSRRPFGARPTRPFLAQIGLKYAW